MPPGIAREDFGVHCSGKIVLQRRPLDLTGLVGTGLDTFRAAGRFDRHHVTQDLQSCWGRAIRPGWSRSRQTCSTMRSTTHRQGGRIHVALSSNGDEIVLTVSDNGVGIGPDLLPLVFDLFVQEPGSLNRSCGLGISLSLVRRVVELHEGVVEMSSASRGLGSTSTVRLHQTQAARISAPQPAGSRARTDISVLIIEDNAEGRELLALVLGGQRY